MVMRASLLYKNLLREKYILIPIIIFSPILLAAIFADYIAPYPPLKTGVGPSLTEPTSAHIMGTDQAGGDIFSQVVYGARTSLYVAFVSTTLAVAIGLAVGVPSGYFNRRVDEVLMRIVDVVLSIPSFILIIFLIVLFGSNILTLTIVIGLVGWPTLARIVRAQILSVREREFVLAIRALGASPLRIMFNEILPNVILPLIPAIMLQLGYAVLVESGVSFLGLGDQNIMSWGRVLWMASRSIYVGAWWGLIFPGMAILITIISLNLLGDGISKIINPKTAKRG